MEIEKLLSFGVILLYSLGAFGIIIGTLSSRRQLKYIANRITLAGFCLHSVELALALYTLGFAEFSRGQFMQLLAWCIIFIYIAAWRWLRLPFLGLTAAPLALLLYILSMRSAKAGGNLLPEHLSGLFFGLHIWSLYLSLGLLAMAFGSGLLFVYTENKLKKKMPLAEFTKDMPSLATYDKVNMLAVLAGFPLFTLGLMAGFVWAPMAVNLVESPKTLVSLFVWMLYALLFYQRMALRYRGRKTAVMAIVIFCVSALSFVIDYSASHHSNQFLP